ncbi:MAG: hypothetical protein IMY85_11185 [Chloroflexi bacterium]|nr:hypothetical protein [Chloroflexota bacterium]
MTHHSAARLIQLSLMWQADRHIRHLHALPHRQIIVPETCPNETPTRY